MPIKIDSDLPARSILEKENIFVMTQERAMSQDIRPLKIAIVNLMPTKEVTETQLLRLLSNTPLQIDITLFRMEGHISKNTNKTHLDRFYMSSNEIFNHKFEFTYACVGGCAIDKFGEPLPESELCKCMNSDSVLLGAVGGNKWNDVPADLRPEKALLKLRQAMGVYSNNRPAKIWRQLSESSPLKKEIVDKGIDFIIVRELTGGIYFGEHSTIEKNGESVATDVLTYSEREIERIGRIAFETAQKRNKKLFSHLLP